MSEVKLVKPQLKHKEDAENFKQEFFDHGEKIINGSSLFDQMNYEDWLLHLEKNSSPKTVDENWVVADTFFAVETQNEKIVGIIDIRHNLENDLLKNYAGHIGYATRPSERKKGYATKMMQEALMITKKLNIKTVMIGCNSDNEASKKVIEKSGGKLVEKKLYIDSTPINIYNIEIQ